MLAKNLSTPRGVRFIALSLTSFASMLAPTRTALRLVVVDELGHFPMEADRQQA